MRWLIPLLTLIVAPWAMADSNISWKKVVIDKRFRSEGVAVADVNKDGKLDILTGEFWYQAPDWTPHEMQKPGNYGDGKNGYSKIFACWAEDLNKDGFPDLIVIDFPGVPCYWLENPKVEKTTTQVKHWKRHNIWHSACNETPQYVDLFGTGKRVLIMGFQPKGEPVNANIGQMAYFTPNPKDPTLEWIMHPISLPSEKGKPVPGTFRYSHGLGVGDVNKDGRNDVVTIGGWWEQPQHAQKEDQKPWPFHPTTITDPCADMFVLDFDGDGRNDILSTSAHKFGIWWHQQREQNQGHPIFQKKALFPDLVSETHAAHLVDLDGDGEKDLITGKRWWSHGTREPGSEKPAMLYWIKMTRAKDKMLKAQPLVIDNDSGIGTQFVVQDVNGDQLLDLVVSNKKGVYLFLQARSQ